MLTRYCLLAEQPLVLLTRYIHFAPLLLRVVLLPGAAGDARAAPITKAVEAHLQADQQLEWGSVRIDQGLRLQLLPLPMTGSRVVDRNPPPLHSVQEGGP